MKKYAKELVILLLQILLFYAYPAYAFRIDPMGAVFIMLFVTLVLSLVLGICSRSGLKWAYPAACAVVFLPTVPIYYNSSALVHALWYLVVAAVGLAIGSGLGALGRKTKK
jgi:hypothetical protein